MFGVDQELVEAVGLFVIAAPLVMYADSRGRRWLLLACTVVWGLLVLRIYVGFRLDMVSLTATEWAIHVVIMAVPVGCNRYSRTRDCIYQIARAVKMGAGGCRGSRGTACYIVLGIVADLLSYRQLPVAARASLRFGAIFGSSRAA